MNSFYIITFNNAFEATQAEEVCRKEGAAAVVMPTPTYITMSCGISLKTDEENIHRITQMVKSGKMKCKKIYRIQGNKASELEV